MAGVPGTVLRRAQEILSELEQDKPPTPVETQTKRLQMTLFEFDSPPVVEALEKLDINQLTPIDALRLLDEWKKKFL
jgi:DNA mismatch repair protein MutS